MRRNIVKSLSQPDIYQTITRFVPGNLGETGGKRIFLAVFILPGCGYYKSDDAARGLADAARRNPCGCFAAGVEIATEDRPKPIEDLREGDHHDDVDYWRNQ